MNTSTASPERWKLARAWVGVCTVGWGLWGLLIGAVAIVDESPAILLLGIPATILVFASQAWVLRQHAPPWRWAVVSTVSVAAGIALCAFAMIGFDAFGGVRDAGTYHGIDVIGLVLFSVLLSPIFVGIVVGLVQTHYLKSWLEKRFAWLTWTIVGWVSGGVVFFMLLAFFDHGDISDAAGLAGIALPSTCAGAVQGVVSSPAFRRFR